MSEPEPSATEGAAAGAAAAANGGFTKEEVRTNFKKRKLYRQASGNEELWFPHDNHPDFIKELIWESGGPLVKWFFHGTPAAGSGAVGVLAAGTRLIALCTDQHHRTHYHARLQAKNGESMLEGRPALQRMSAIIMGWLAVLLSSE